MATSTVTLDFTYPTAGASASALPLTIGGFPAGTVQILPASAGVELPNSQTLVPGAAASTVSGIIYFVVAGAAPQSIIFNFQNAATVTVASTAIPAPSVISTAPTARSTQAFSSIVSSLPYSASSTQQTAASSNSQTTIPAKSDSTKSSPTKSVSTASSSTSASNHVVSGLSSGAAAGMAIGCLVAGAGIAGLLFWLFWRKAKKSPSQYSDANTVALMSQEKGLAIKSTLPGGQGWSEVALASGLPQPLEDKVISGDISKLSNSIKNHVQSYYHIGRVSPALIDHDNIRALGSDIPISPGALSSLLGNSATREIALRFCIAWVIICRIQPHTERPDSLLPPEIVQCFQEIASANRGSKSHASLMARWRMITAESMQSTYVRNPFTPSDSRNTSVRATVSALDSVLQPYADSRMDNEQRKRNLEEIVKRSALFAFTLFSQPSSWDFDWKEKQGVKSGELCVFPALVQVTDDTGEPIRPPRPFSEAVVRRLDA